MSQSLYREEILEHWKNSQNWGILSDADFSIEDNNPLCGDNIHLTGKIIKEKINDIKFTGDGCVISKASASILTEYAKDKKISELKNLKQEDYLSLIEISLGITRIKCALMPYYALQKGLRSANI